MIDGEQVTTARAKRAGIVGCSMGLTVRELSKSYGRIRAVDRVSLELADREALAILGPSGCGKSTLLRLLAGLETPDGGRVELDGRDITRVPAHRRSIGMVFQDFALFPHLDVAGNVGFALREAGWSRQAIRERVGELLELVNLESVAGRKPVQLSGGQQQRIALARALAARPGLLLLDEPLSDLDPQLRRTLQSELASIVEGSGVRALHVTHDRLEAMAVAPRLAVMREGRILQSGPSNEVLEKPANEWIARFLGYRNIYPRERIPIRGLSGPSLLLRDDLISPGGEIEGIIESCTPFGQQIQLKIFVPGWGVHVHWQGFARELSGLEPVPGNSLGLEIPANAWVALEDDPEASP